MTTQAIRRRARTTIPGFRGELIGPSHASYDETRRLFNAMIDRRPALIARCTDAADVAAALRWARSHELPLSVRGGGHGVAGFALCDDGVVLDMRLMNRVDIDAAACVARAEAGAMWGDLDAATQAFALATTGGRVSTTGIAGQTIGSGSGWLERKCGFTVDNLVAADLVTAEGELVQVSEDENPELLWGLRGAGGNFGVLTALEYRLHPVGPVVLGGLLLYRFEHAVDVMKAWRDYMAQAPDEVGSALVFVTAPPAPFVPAGMQGRPAVGMFAAYFGPVEQGEEILRPLRAHSALAVDLIEPMPYTAIQQLLDPMCPPGQHQYWKSENLSALPDAAIEVFVERAARMTSPSTQFILEPKSGACRRIPDDATPLSRDSAYTFGAFSVWDDPAESELHIAWARETWETLRPWAVPGVVLNYTSDTGEERVRSTFGPEKYARLVALKRRWDPDNVFRSNQNIPPD